MKNLPDFKLLAKAGEVSHDAVQYLCGLYKLNSFITHTRKIYEDSPFIYPGETVFLNQILKQVEQGSSVEIAISISKSRLSSDLYFKKLNTVVLES